MDEGWKTTPPMPLLLLLLLLKAGKKLARTQMVHTVGARARESHALAGPHQTSRRDKTDRWATACVGFLCEVLGPQPCVAAPSPASIRVVGHAQPNQTVWIPRLHFGAWTWTGGVGDGERTEWLPPASLLTLLTLLSRGPRPPAPAWPSKHWAPSQPAP